tara:strand:+ start:1014 stop:1190 length:177 start_codon:yes stop_codon:yes gene_type:complete
MITEKLKSDVRRLSSEDRRELSMYMIKLQLEGDQDYLNTIRERTESYHSREHVAVSDL